MNTNSIADQLLQGSRQINEWRKEIDTLVKILMSLIRDDSLSSDCTIACDDQGTSIWWIKTDCGHPSSIHFIIRPWEGERCVYDSGGEVNTSGYQVRAIRMTLDILVEGLLKTFPKLNQKMKFLLVASQGGESAK